MRAISALGAWLAVACAISAFAQTQSRAALKIVVIEGEDAINVIQQKTAVAPLVEVRDRNNQPVAGAVVTFSVRGANLASFGGSQTLTVTTNAAGRAAAAAFNPVGSGAFQIQVQAAFQGQTAVAAIAQTNVMTVAEAATAAGSTTSGGAGATSSGGAAGGSSGGLSATTLGVVGAAVAGGAVVATQVGGDDKTSAGSSAKTYQGPYSVTFVMTVTNEDGSSPCTHVNRYSGTLKMSVTDQGGSVSGSATMDGTKAEVGPNTCGGPIETFFTGVDSDLPLSGTAAALTFNRQRTFPPSNSVTLTETLAFTGAIGQGSIAGSLTVTRRETGSPGPRPRVGTGTGTVQVTLQ